MYIKNLLYGLIVGIGFIIPGVSGGVVATILGIYEETIDRLCNLRKDFLNNIKFLFPLISGIILSIFLFSKIILYLLNNNLNFISYVFIGLILGCIPYLLCEIKTKCNKSISLPFFLITFSFGILLFLIEKNNVQNLTQPNFMLMLFAGVMYSIGKLVPGISGAALLMLLGIYEFLLSLLANPLKITLNQLFLLIPFFLSFLFSSILIIKLINYLLNNHFRATYSAIIGFIFSSILFIYPNSISLINIITMILAFIISYNFSK